MTTIALCTSCRRANKKTYHSQINYIYTHLSSSTESSTKGNITWVYMIIKTHKSIRIQTKAVVKMADIVPTGIDFWASSKSPDLLDPAIMPEKGRKDIYG